jgi:DNA-binding NarL/FixJ family response regulator
VFFFGCDLYPPRAKEAAMPTDTWRELEMGEPVRIVLADDSDLLRRVLVRFLSQTTAVALVGVAADVPETMHVLRESQPHVLLFDLHMAVRHEDRCHELKAASEHVTLVAISVDAGKESQDLADRCGATCLVDKMEMHGQLIPAILRSVGKGELRN